MSAFKLVEGEYAIVVAAGVYKQVPVATRNGLLYAVVGNGYVQLRADGTTSKDKLRLDEITWEGKLHASKLGKLCTSDVRDSKLLNSNQLMRLLPAPETEEGQ